jgi:hypothetical protein
MSVYVCVFDAETAIPTKIIRMTGAYSRRQAIMFFEGRIQKLAMLAAASCMSLAADSIVYSDFGPDQTFGDGAWNIGSTQSIGSSFMPSASGTLSQIDIPLESSTGLTGPSVTVKLETANNGLPSGTVLESWTSGTISATDAMVYTFLATGAPVTLSTGTEYWVLVTNFDPNDTDAWAENPSQLQGNLAVNSQLATFNGAWTPAFEVDVTSSSAPEPATWPLATAGLFVLMAASLWRSEWIARR